MRRKNTDPEVLNYFYYDETSRSCLRWKIYHHGNEPHSEVGYITSKGYWRVQVNGRIYAIHVLIWELHNGILPSPQMVDHKDLNSSNNRIKNLRPATQAQNQFNTNKKNNISGIKGLSWMTKKERWAGQINHNGITHRFSSKDKDEVIKWLIVKRNQLHGEFARH